MKYLKRFEKLEDNSEILSDLQDILSDLKDEYFDISILPGTWKNNYCIMIGFLKDTTGGVAKEFKLSEIKEYIDRLIEYLQSNGYYIEDIDAFDLSKSLKFPGDKGSNFDCVGAWPCINEWDLDTKVIGINFYFNN